MAIRDTLALTYSNVSEAIEYDDCTGKLFWKTRPAFLCKSELAAKRWNIVYAGKEAFTSDNGHGYRVGSIFGRFTQAHRVVWLLSTGKWPDGQIDHINGVRHDNRMSNLRVVSHAENGRNQRFRKNNSSGALGVVWREDRRKWVAMISVMGKTKNIGAYENKEDASKARALASAEHGFHPNHGSRI